MQWLQQLWPLYIIGPEDSIFLNVPSLSDKCTDHKKIEFGCS